MLKGSGPSRVKPVITSSIGWPGGTHHISPKLRTSTKRNSCSFEFQKRTRVCLHGSEGCSCHWNWPVMRRCTPQTPPSGSRAAIRYFPLRCHCPTVIPQRPATNSSGPPGLAMALGLQTSTCAILKSTRRSASPRRTVSTSGSSGNGLRQARVPLRRNYWC